MAYEPAIDPNNVRGVIDISLDEVALPDTVIGLGIYTGRAVAEVKRRVPLYADSDAEQAQRLNQAADYLCASYLVAAIPNLTREAFGDESYQREAWDVDSKIASLQSLADSEINEVLNPGILTSSMPQVFTLAKGRRGL